MKKLLTILFLGIISLSSPVNAGAIGSGELTLSQGTVNSWKQYIKGGLNQKNPMVFLVTLDGYGSYFWYCDYPQCAPGNSTIEIQACERHYKGKECKIFARRRTIKWKNNINKGNKKSRFNSKMSDAEVIARLTELGFLKDSSSQTQVESSKSTITKKKDKSSTAGQLQKIIDQYKSGLLTEEEFIAAKKKILE